MYLLPYLAVLYRSRANARRARPYGIQSPRLLPHREYPLSSLVSTNLHSMIAILVTRALTDLSSMD